MKLCRTVAVAAALYAFASGFGLYANAGPRVVLYMGLGDALFAGSLNGLAEQLRRCGANVVVLPWYAPASGRFDVAMGQSAGTSTLDKTDAGIKIALDPTARFQPAKPVTRSYYTDGIGVRLPHSPNIYIPRAGHVTLPRVVSDDVVRFVFAGKCGRVTKG